MLMAEIGETPSFPGTNSLAVLSRPSWCYQSAVSPISEANIRPFLMPSKRLGTVVIGINSIKTKVHTGAVF